MEKYILLIIVIVLALWVVSVYNALASGRLKVANQWSQIDVQLKMRADLIPNIVETVKGYATHESETLQNVTEARTKFLSATTSNAQIAATGELSGALSRLMAISESYPDLKANTNFLQLQENLNELEQKIAVYRQFYNDIVMKYNRMLIVFPKNIIGKLFGFKAEAFFATNEADKIVPQVKF